MTELSKVDVIEQANVHIGEILGAPTPLPEGLWSFYGISSFASSRQLKIWIQNKHP